MLNGLLLMAEQARELLDRIDISTVVGLRDRVLNSVTTLPLPQA